MEVVLLGSGSADGWPNPFCDCASCRAAVADGRIRGQSAALIDNRVLLDCGPEAPRAALRHGRNLRDARVLLLTHVHPDHLDPAALLWRAWSGTNEPLDVVGTPDTVAAYQPWLGPAGRVDGPVRLHTATPGQRLTLDRYRCTALDGTHEVPTLLWDVEDLRDGTRLLYATDTGPLSPQTLDAVAGRDYNLVLLDETFGDRYDHGTGHLDLRTFPRQLAALRRVGAVGPGTGVVATHLGHHNPPPRELARRLAAWGVVAGVDGDVFVAGAPAGIDHEPVDGRTLLLGGARSGKSTEAERLLAAEPVVVYAATAGTHRDDAEWQARIAAHRARRPETWTTMESPDLARLLGQPGPPLLIDCLSLWLTGVLDAAGAWEPETWPQAQQRVHDDVGRLVAAWRATRRRVVAVSNEVGGGVVPATWAGRVFRDELGRLNALVAAASDKVFLVIAGTVTPLRD